MVWDSAGSSGTDTSGNSIQGQRYASDGSAQGAQFQVNTYTTGNQRAPSVAADADGDFVVVWDSDGSSGTDTSGFSIQGQRYASDGSAQGARVPGQQLIRRAIRFIPPWRRMPTGTSSWCGAAIGRLAGTDAGSLQHPGPALRLGRIDRRAPVPGQHLHDAAPVHSLRGGGGGGNFVVVWDSIGSSGTDTSRPAASRASATACRRLRPCQRCRTPRDSRSARR